MRVQAVISMRDSSQELSSSRNITQELSFDGLVFRRVVFGKINDAHMRTKFWNDSDRFPYE